LDVAWTSRQLQIAASVCLVVALVALFAFDESAVFWVFIAASLAIAAFDYWENRRQRG
jgi:hypothetical protein